MSGKNIIQQVGLLKVQIIAV